MRKGDFIKVALELYWLIYFIELNYCIISEYLFKKMGGLLLD